MAGGRHKHPKAAFQPANAKIAKSITPPDYRRENPSWRVGEMLMVDPYGWRSVTAEQLLKIHTRLKEFERLTWGEILTPRQGRPIHHRHPVNQIADEAREQLRRKKLDDTEDLVSLRLEGRARIWGVLQGSVLLILWWDPDHLVYPMNIADN